MIPLVDLVAQYHSIQTEMDAAVRRVFESGQFVLGPEVASLEEEIAAYLGVRYGVGVASGTDALVLTLRALGIGPGDEVIVPAFTFFATAGAVLSVGARPVFVDIYPNTYCLDVDQIPELITPRTKAILPVHLYGHPANMDAILNIATQYGLKVIEDNAQAFGAEYQGRKTGSIGQAACLSFYPTKNLGGAGDGGMVVTDDPEIASRVRMLRTHGWQKKYHPEMLGVNSRLDALQAALLRVKLPHVDAWNAQRRAVADCYRAELSHPGLVLPYELPGCYHIYHLFVLRTSQRDHLRQALQEAGISCDVYYPQALHLLKPCQFLGYAPGAFPVAERACQEVLAIPIYPELSNRQVQDIAATINLALSQG